MSFYSKVQSVCLCLSDFWIYDCLSEVCTIWTVGLEWLLFPASSHWRCFSLDLWTKLWPTLLISSYVNTNYCNQHIPTYTCHSFILPFLAMDGFTWWSQVLSECFSNMSFHYIISFLKCINNNVPNPIPAIACWKSLKCSWRGWVFKILKCWAKDI